MIDILKDMLEYRARGFIPEISEPRFKAIQWAINEIESQKKRGDAYAEIIYQMTKVIIIWEVRWQELKEACSHPGFLTPTSLRLFEEAHPMPDDKKIQEDQFCVWL